MGFIFESMGSILKSGFIFESMGSIFESWDLFSNLWDLFLNHGIYFRIQLSGYRFLGFRV